MKTNPVTLTDTSEQPDEKSARKRTRATSDGAIDILQIERGSLEVCVLGASPIVLNRLSEKVARQLLLPVAKGKNRRNLTTLKHDPVAEYQASPYRLADPNAPTLLAFPCAGFKKGMMTASIDLPGTSKAQTGRLIVVEGELTPLHGVPRLFMRAVRGADIARTPDIRTRAIVDTWACRLSIVYTKPLITPQAVVNLLAAAGMIVGVGDGRPEKGTLSFGQFKIVAPDDPEYLRVIADGGRVVQEQAMKHPIAYDDESAELLSWFEEELTRRQQRGDARAVAGGEA